MAALATESRGTRLGETDPQILCALRSAATYGQSGPVEVCETHASWVFLVGGRAYTIKKPVALGFLDYSTLAARRAACREEVAVNREPAAEVYLGVRAILTDGDGLRLAGEDSPEAVEYAVEMRRFDEAQTIAGLIDAGALEPSQLGAVGRRLARFHARAPQRAGGRAAQALESWRRNIAELQALEHDPSWRLDLLASFGESFVHAHHDEIEQRAAQGHVRDGHGDLRCEHVLLAPSLAILDRIEFDRALREVDVCADLAFLAMDLESHGQAWAARELVGAYREAGGDPGSQPLRSFYAAERALVRVKVRLLDAAEHTGTHREVALERAGALIALAERLCWRARRPLAVLLCGPPASGKSTLTEELLRRTDLAVLSSDLVRKRLAGLPASARAAPEHYSEDFTARRMSTWPSSARAPAERRRRDPRRECPLPAPACDPARPPGRAWALPDGLLPDEPAADDAQSERAHVRRSPRLKAQDALGGELVRGLEVPHGTSGDLRRVLETATTLAEQVSRVSSAVDSLCAEGEQPRPG